MNRHKQKPYLEFGGNAFYINLDAILETIRIENQTQPEILVKQSPQVEIKETKSSRKKKIIEPEPIVEQVETTLDENIGIQVDISKWEILRLMIDAIMHTNTDVDDKLGMAGLNNNTPIPFKIAFNTLLKYNILQEEE